MRLFHLFISLALTSALTAQPNCEAFKYLGDEKRYKACKAAEKRAGHYQFSKEYQMALDEALEIDSTFAFAYRAKSTAYLKSGDFITWKKLIDKAVLYDPTGNLFYRASCRYQFFRDYAGTIADIELLDSLVDYDIGHSQNGDYHLHILRALSYKALGQKEKAIQIIRTQLQDSQHFPGVYDYLHLGVLFLETGAIESAIEALKKQADFNDLAENRFYLALAYKQQGNTTAYQEHLQFAREQYLAGFHMHDPYVSKMDEIFLSKILEEIQLSQKE